MSEKLVKATWKELLLHFLGRRKAFLIEGDSMLPTLANGDKVLVDPNAYVTRGDIVLAVHPYKKTSKIVKRVTTVEEDGRLTLTGDNPATSTDSRAFGTVSIESIIGKVTSKLK